MEVIDFNLGWNRKRWFANSLLSPDDEKIVNLPDDFIIDTLRNPKSVGGAFAGFFEGGQATYEKKLYRKSEWEKKSVFLYIDGAYMNSQVSINKEHIQFHPYGYTPFLTDLTPWLRAENTVEILTQCRQPNSRWYTGAGVYRQVQLWIGGKLYIHPWSIVVQTRSVAHGKAHVQVTCEVTSTAQEESTPVLNFEVWEKSVQTRKTVEREQNICVPEQSKTTVSFELTIPDVKVWDIEQPNLYELVIMTTLSGETVDCVRQTFGVRTIAMDAKNGMKLNGRSITMRGGCIHHDYGMLGTSSCPAAEERKLRLLKEAGYQAIRTSHNPQSFTFLNLCDQIGILVLEEAFDCWTKEKTGNDYHIFFRDWWQRDLEAMIQRDRNHPCIFGWSIGNEIEEFTGSRWGEEWTRKLSNFVRTLDNTRPVTVGQHGMIDCERAEILMQGEFHELQGKTVQFPGVIDGIDYWDAQTKGAYAHLELAGYNYIWPRYSTDAKKHPDRVIIATETHPFTMYDYWKAALENPNCIGDFLWTAMDNIGEAGSGRVIWEKSADMGGFLGDYPWLANCQGDFDLAGNRRAQSFYHKIIWGLDAGIYLFTQNPIHNKEAWRGTGWHWYDVYPEWTFDEKYVGKPVAVQAYADCDEVEFLINGRTCAKIKPEKCIASCFVLYEKGCLEAVAYKNGRAQATARLETVGDAAQVSVSTQKTVLRADGMDLTYLEIEVQDENGKLVSNKETQIAVCANGAEVSVALGSGNPCTEENYGTGMRKSWQGKVLAAVRAGIQCGQVAVTVRAEELNAEKVIYLQIEKE